MFIRNMLIIHHSCVYITYEWINDHFPIVFLNKIFSGHDVTVFLGWRRRLFPLSTTINVTSRSLICGLNISQPTVSGYHKYLVATNISSPRLVFIQLVTIPKNGFSEDEVAALARLNQSVGHVTFISGSRKWTRLCCRSRINVRY